MQELPCPHITDIEYTSITLGIKSGSKMKTIIPTWNNVECNYCFHIDSLPLSNNVVKVDCSACHLTRLPCWIYVTEVSCQDCLFITSLPYWPNVTKVTCIDCPLLTLLPRWTNITNFGCYYCDKLTLLPNWPKLTQLRCEYCDKLTSFSNWPKIKNIEIVECRSIINIPCWTSLESIIYSDYTDRTTISLLPNWPNITKIELWGAFSLKNFPIWPKVKHIKFDNIFDFVIDDNCFFYKTGIENSKDAKDYHNVIKRLMILSVMIKKFNRQSCL
jgi:hypothetical protein